MSVSSTNIFDRRVIMAPMAGVNTPAFCTLLRENDCDFIYSGLLTSHGLIHHNKKTGKILAEFSGEVTTTGQLFGAVPEIMAEAAGILLTSGNIHMIDINMGCPVPKVVKSRAGARLMQDPDLAAEIVRAVVRAVDVPVTVKMRSGWDKENLNCIDLAKRCRDEGAAAVALHPRTRSQGFSGEADWSFISRMKEALDVPVIASGDIVDEETAERCFRETGCDSIMIGRAAIGNPCLIGRIKHYLATGEKMPTENFRARLANARRQLELHVEEMGPRKGVYEMRSPMAKYVHGLPDATTFRAAVNKTDTMEAVIELIEEYKNKLEKREIESKSQ